MRETSDLTTRLSRRDREDLPRTTFSVMTPEFLKEIADRWEASTVGGKTSEGRAKQIARRERLICEYRHKQAVSERYHAETNRIREASGVEKVKYRVSVAKSEFRASALAVSRARATTPAGLRMKAEALKADDLVATVAKQNGILGDLVRFIDATLDVLGRASA